VEFGYKAQVVDNANGVILDHSVEIGAPPDAPMLAPAIARAARRTGRAPRAVTTDRGYGHAVVESDLHALGVKKVVIPARPSPAQPDESRNTGGASAAWSSGAPDRRAGSVTSNTATAGTTHGWTASTGPERGADSWCSPTTW
jgi:IS5 family transposase